jgi:hypothetical protein
LSIATEGKGLKLDTQPITLTWILTELWLFLTLEDSTLSRLLFYPHALKIEEHADLSTTIVFVRTFLSRLYEVYRELSYSPRCPRLDFRLKFWCSKIFFTITLSFLKVSTSNICSLSSTTSYVTRLITLAPILSDLSSLELRIFLKKYYFLLLLLYFLLDKLHTSNICSLSSSTSYVTRFITLAPIFSDLSPLELRIFLKKYFFTVTYLCLKRSTSYFNYICSLPLTTSDVTRFINLAPIFSDLSPLELRIFLKKYYFLL